MTRCRAFGLVLFLLALAPAVRADDKKPAPIPDNVSYYKDVRPIFVLHCQGCHQPAKPMGGFVMTSHADLLKKGDSDEPAAVPGKPDASKIVAEVAREKGGKGGMAKNKAPLGDRDREIIKKWIAQGAKDDTPMSAKHVVDAEHPPSYSLLPVVSSVDFSPDGKLLAVSGYH